MRPCETGASQPSNSTACASISSHSPSSAGCRFRASTRAVHGRTDREREWLEYAAILHDIGVHISYERHHKHSGYLIKNGDLRGFEPDEIDAGESIPDEAEEIAVAAADLQEPAE